MKRRAFITLLGGAAAWPVVARSQQPALPVVGVLLGVSAAEWAAPVASLRRGLNETGFVEGRNVAIEYRSADGQSDLMPGLLADLIGRKVAVLFVGGNAPGVRAAIAATQAIPIVFTTGTDPVASGLVDSLNRPGGNATGVTFIVGEMGSKRLELLREIVPHLTKLALLVNPGNQLTSREDIEGVGETALHLGLEIIVVNGGSDDEIERSFAAAVQNKADALIVGSDAYFNSRRDRLAALGLQYAMPTVASFNSFAKAGLMMSYGADQLQGFRQAGVYIGRILKGDKPVELPVMQPTKFDLVINLKTARALGLTVPPNLLALADEVIE